MNEYFLAWAMEEVADRGGWERTTRVLTQDRVEMIFVKKLEPEPGLGKLDEA